MGHPNYMHALDYVVMDVMDVINYNLSNSVLVIVIIMVIGHYYPAIQL